MDGRTRSGISTYDLADLARELERQHHGSVHWRLDLPVRNLGGPAISVRVAFTGGGTGLDCSHYERGVAGAFPARGGRTLVGELYRVTWELEQKLEWEARVREQL